MDVNLELLFSAGNTLALCGWLSFLSSPWLPRVANTIAGLIIPLLFAAAYSALILVFWSDATGGYDSLENVMQLFTFPPLVVAGWLHYLAFDLLIGVWQVNTARELKLPFLLLVPCLFLIFMFGPAGFLLFSVFIAVRKAQVSATAYA